MTSFDLMRSLSRVDAKYVRKTDVFYRRAPTWRSIMKKTTKFALSAAAIVLVAGFVFWAWWAQNQVGVAEEGERGQDKPVIHVLIDLVLSGEGASCEQVERFITNNASKCGKEYEVVVEALPTIMEPEKRNAAITSMQIQMLSGEGPDVFLLRNMSDYPGIIEDVKNLFPNPVSAMKQGLFLSLDGYLQDNSDWNRLNVNVMSGGKYGGSQQIIPLSYKLRVGLVNSAEYTLTDKLPMSCWDMLTSNDSAIKQCIADPVDMLGQLADYEREELLFTEDELTSIVSAVKERYDQDEYYASSNTIVLGPMNEDILNGNEETAYYLIPSYNKNSGVTAQVGTYTAINHSTKYPEQSFDIVQSFFSMEGQCNDMITCLFLPSRTGLGCEETPAASGWYLEDWEYQQMLQLEEGIDAVEYNSQLRKQLINLFESCLHLEESEIKEAVRAAYNKMQKLIDEM